MRRLAGMSDRVIINVSNGIADVRLNRPDKRNALDGAMFAAIAEAGEELKSRSDVRAVVLSGEGASFCAGLDFSLVPARWPTASGTAAPAGDRGGNPSADRRAAGSPTSASSARGCGRRCRSR